MSGYQGHKALTESEPPSLKGSTAPAVKYMGMQRFALFESYPMVERVERIFCNVRGKAHCEKGAHNRPVHYHTIPYSGQLCISDVVLCTVATCAHALHVTDELHLSKVTKCRDETYPPKCRYDGIWKNHVAICAHTIRLTFLMQTNWRDISIPLHVLTRQLLLFVLIPSCQALRVFCKSEHFYFRRTRCWWISSILRWMFALCFLGPSALREPPANVPWILLSNTHRRSQWIPPECG